MGFTSAADETVPVLIVGGGGAGLTASMLLARQGVEHLLVSARATTSDLPKAHVLNQRAMEVLDDVGVADGNRRPIRDLVASGRFLVIAGEDGEAWCQAARQLAADAGLPLDAVRIGHLDGDVYDPRCAWLCQREIQSDGAILVRPDRFIAWRQATSAEDPRSVLAGALRKILARPIGAPVPAGAIA
jgi:FAD binding domain-containing protein/aromatic ring hydroxylase-like protein